MSGITVVKANEFNTDIIAYGQPKQNTSGGKSVNIMNAEVKRALYLSSPLMYTYGVSDYEGNERYEMSLQFPSEEYSNPKLDQFLQVLKDFEAKIKEDAMSKHKEWFGKTKPLSADVIDALWTPMLKYPKNKETREFDYTKAPTLRVKVPCYEGKWSSNIFNTDYEQVFPDSNDSSLTPLDFISKGSNVAAVIQCGGIWFANGKFGVTWRLHQAVTQPRASKTQVCHIELDDDEKNVLRVKAKEDTDEVNEAFVESDDEEEVAVEEEEEEVVEAEEEPEPEPEPVVVKKKKVVKKKA